MPEPTAPRPPGGSGATRRWVADPRVPWNILLTARLATVPDPSALLPRLAGALAEVGWPGPAPAVRRGPSTAALQTELAALTGFPPSGPLTAAAAPLTLAVHDDTVVVRAHHAVCDGLGLLAVLGAVTDVPVASNARGVGGGRPAAGGLAAVAARLREVALRPPARLPDTRVGGRRSGASGDVLVELDLDAEPGTAELVSAAAAVLGDRVGAAARSRVSVAVGVSRTGGAAPVVADHSGLLRLTGLDGVSPDDVRALLRTAPLQTAPGGQGGALVGRATTVGLRVLAPRLGSSILVSHLGRVTAPGVQALAFHPVTAGGSGLSLGAVTVRGRTTLTLRARARQHSADGLRQLLESVGDRVAGSTGGTSRPVRGTRG